MITTTSTVLHDGERNVSMLFSGMSDGVGQETNVVKVDVTLLTPACKRVSIVGVSYEVSGGLVVLAWEATDPIPFDQLAFSGERDYRRFNGFTVPVDLGGGVTGNIVLSTIGFDIGSSYSFSLDMLKKF